MWQIEHMLEIAKSWDLKSKPGRMIFRDWLTEQGQYQWANMVLWTELHTKHWIERPLERRGIAWWFFYPELKTHELDGCWYGNWERYADRNGMEILAP